MPTTEAWWYHCAGCGSCAWFTRSDGTRYCSVCGGIAVKEEEPFTPGPWWTRSYEPIATHHFVVSVWPLCWAFGIQVDATPPTTSVGFWLYIGPVRILLEIGAGDGE